MRLFIAINFSNKVKDYLSEVQDIIKSSAIKGNYTLYDNFHLTIRFLGEMTESESHEIQDLLDEIHLNPFTIKIGDINSFNRKGKHIVYVDVLKNKNKLYELVKTVNQKIDAHFSLEKSYSFKPHITIGREVVFRDISSLQKVHPFTEEIKVKEIALMLSHRNKQNVLTYTPLYTKKINEENDDE